jgi:hypothetical protein
MDKICFQTDRPYTLSLMLNEFLSAYYLKTVICAKPKTTAKTKQPDQKKAVVNQTKPSAQTQTAADQD